MVLKNNQVWWEDHNCLAPDVHHHAVAPICQKDTTASQPQTTTEQPETTTVLSCPDQWTEFDGNCYQYFATNSYWANADTDCLLNGGRLTSIHSSEEEEFFQSLAGGNSFWIGGYPKDNSWVWSDGTDLDYTHFHTEVAGYCLYQDASYYSSGWSQDYCTSSSSHYYICKLIN